MGRRMFSPQIIDSDAFLDMPSSTQALYFHLGMRADDDGFVGSPKKILRLVGGNDDDLKMLLLKRFVLSFESGVIVIKHWRINNLVRKDWYRETVYLEEKKQLTIKENGSYTELVNENVPKLAQVRPRSIGKDKIGKDKIINTAETSSAFSLEEKMSLMENSKDKRMNIIHLYWLYKKFEFENNDQYSAALKRELRPSKLLIGYDILRIKDVMFWLNGEDWIDWTLETVHKYIDKDLNNIKSKI